MTELNSMSRSDQVIGAILFLCVIALFIFVFMAGSAHGENKALTKQLDELKAKEKQRLKRLDDVGGKIKRRTSRSSPMASISPTVRTVSNAAEYHGVPLKVMLGVCYEESRCRQFKNGRLVKSHVPTVVGYMQIKGDVWAKKKGGCPYASKQSDLRREDINIWCGAYILAHYKKRYGTWERALWAYNGGPPAVRVNDRGGNFGTTRTYARKVLWM